MSINFITYLTISIITALIVALFQYYKASKISNNVTKYILITLKTISITAILLLFLDLYYESKNYKKEKSPLYILLDNSQSIKNRNLVSEIEKLKNQFSNSNVISDKYYLKFYQFGDNLEVLDSLDYSDQESNLELALDNIPEFGRHKNIPVVVVSDGNLTNSNKNFAIHNKSFDLYPIVVGDTTKYFDLELKQINHNKFSTPNSNIPLEILLNSNFNQNYMASIEISSGQDKIISKSLKFHSKERGKIIRCTIPSGKLGENFFKITVASSLKEKNLINNTKEFSLTVLDNSINVSIVSSLSHPDIGALSRALNHYKNLNVRVINPDKSININDTDILVLYQPNESYSEILNFIKAKSLSYCVISGNHTDFKLLNQFQEDYNFSLVDINEQSSGILKLNTNFKSFKLDSIVVNTLPLLESPATINSSNIIDDNTLFYTQTSENKNPVIKLLETNSERVVVINGENFWKWRVQFYQNKNTFQEFDYLCHTLIQYLFFANLKKSHFDVIHNSEIRHLSNDKIRVTYYDKNFQPSLKNELKITTKHIDNDYINTATLKKTDNYYEYDAANLNPGKYTYKIYDQINSHFHEGSFVISSYNAENKYLTSNFESMKNLLKNNDQVFTTKTSDSLLNILKETNNYLPLQTEQISKKSLIELNYLLFIIIFSLSLEWFINKYFGEF